MVAFYDFEHAFTADTTLESDQGASDTYLKLVNGGRAMRVADGAYPGSNGALQTQQISPTVMSNDDHKAGVWSEAGVPSLRRFNGVKEMTIMGWFKLNGPAPAPNSNSANPDDRYGAIGLAGVLSGDSDGHAVRALLEVFVVRGELRLVALGRRIDGSARQEFAASAPWQTLLPQNEWVFLAATFDFNSGKMALYRNGFPLPGFYSQPGDPWGIGGPGPHVTSPTDPRGIKIGGSFPQNNRENNPCNCRMDNLMFLDRAASPGEIKGQYLQVTRWGPTP
jgi:hypothetical protein